jgi:hypothetical protein
VRWGDALLNVLDCISNAIKALLRLRKWHAKPSLDYLTPLIYIIAMQKSSTYNIRQLNIIPLSSFTTEARLDVVADQAGAMGLSKDSHPFSKQRRGAIKHFIITIDNIATAHFRGHVRVKEPKVY